MLTSSSLLTSPSPLVSLRYGPPTPTNICKSVPPTVSMSVCTDLPSASFSVCEDFSMASVPPTCTKPASESCMPPEARMSSPLWPSCVNCRAWPVPVVTAIVRSSSTEVVERSAKSITWSLASTTFTDDDAVLLLASFKLAFRVVSCPV